MAAPPVKSQPLHNFSLPHLKWARKNSSSSASGSTSHQHRFRRRDSPDQLHQRAPDADSNSETAVLPRNDVVSVAEGEEENEAGKPWNLRPRREVIKTALNSNKETAAENNNNGQKVSSCNGVKSQRLRGLMEGRQLNGGVERKQKRKVWVSLSREEIEEDVYALTGGKPARRPKKWPKNVQKHLDCVFPGLCLVGITPDSYRIYDALDDNIENLCLAEVNTVTVQRKSNS